MFGSLWGEKTDDFGSSFWQNERFFGDFTPEIDEFGDEKLDWSDDSNDSMFSWFPENFVSQQQEEQSSSNVIMDKFGYHKDLFPLVTSDWLVLVLGGLGLVIASGGGIGGGGFLVPLYILVLGFHPKHAIPLANATIFGGAVANCIFNVRKRREAKISCSHQHHHSSSSSPPMKNIVTLPWRSVIDLDIIVMMEPSTILGAVVGSFMSKFLPDILLTGSLSIILFFMAKRTLEKAAKLSRKEREEAEDAAAILAGSSPQGNDDNNPLIINFIYDGISTRSLGKSAAFFVFFLGTLGLTLLRGGGNFHLVTKCGTPLFWLISFAPVPFCLLFCIIFRRMLLDDDKTRKAPINIHQQSSIIDAGSHPHPHCHPPEDEICMASFGDILWTPRNTIRYPLLCSFAGLFAGLFGVGGGIVKGPLMLEMGVPPLVASATAATMIFFTSSAASLSFYVFGLLHISYGIALCIFGFISTVIGQIVVYRLVNCLSASSSNPSSNPSANPLLNQPRVKRQSPIVWSIGLVIAISSVAMLIETMAVNWGRKWQDIWQTDPICNDEQALYSWNG